MRIKFYFSKFDKYCTVQQTKAGAVLMEEEGWQHFGGQISLYSMIQFTYSTYIYTVFNDPLLRNKGGNDQIFSETTTIR